MEFFFPSLKEANGSNLDLVEMDHRLLLNGPGLLRGMGGGLALVLT